MSVTFVPPRCPNRSCRFHARPEGRFYWRYGSYTATCHDDPVPRFRCKGCLKTFSMQTFRSDWRDHRPDRNELLFRLLTSGVGLRQAARVLEIGVTTVQKKMRKMGTTCRQLHRNLCRRLPAESVYLLDEEESFESASIRPLTVPVVIEKYSWFVVATAVGPIRRLAPPGTRRRELQDREEQDRGPRRDRSRRCVGLVLGRLRQGVPEGRFALHTDEKASYATIAKELFGDRVEHGTTSGRAPRTQHNPLFAINTTMAMTRDNNGRLRRRSWLVSKRGRYLRRQMHVFTAYRNYVRKRFNHDKERKVTSAFVLGLIERDLRPEDVLRWRQDWGDRSPHPLSIRAERTVAEALQEQV
jgi:transposase-like protein